MGALPLFDLAFWVAETLGSEGAVRSQIVELAERLIGSALTDLRYIIALDSSFAPANDSTFDARVSALLGGMYDEWARSAGAVLERVSRVRQAGHAVRGFEELRDNHGRTLAMLKITVEAVESAREQVRLGRVSSIEDVRHELRSRARR